MRPRTRTGKALLRAALSATALTAAGCGPTFNLSIDTAEDTCPPEPEPEVEVVTVVVPQVIAIETPPPVEPTRAARPCRMSKAGGNCRSPGYDDGLVGLGGDR